jgi:glycosyltransferase involved in cell wall biosynthesis
MFNRRYYLSNDHVATISKVTNEIVKEAAPEVNRTYIPHAVHPDIFRPFTDEEIKNIRERSLSPEDREKVIFFWNNRNARRKQSGTLIWWFKEWLDNNDLHNKAQLIMHTEPKDPHGQDLQHILDRLGLNNRQVLLSTQKVPPQDLASIYNMVDCTINISDAEGFGLATLESLSCATPIIVNMTGGLQEQVTDGEKEFGIPIYPASKAIIGSQEVPYIYEDRIDKKQFHSALNKIYKMGQENRRQMGLDGRQHVLNNYNFLNFEKQWVELMDSVYENKTNRDIINVIRFKEVA